MQAYSELHHKGIDPITVLRIARERNKTAVAERILWHAQRYILQISAARYSAESPNFEANRIMRERNR